MWGFRYRLPHTTAVVTLMVPMFGEGAPEMVVRMPCGVLIERHAVTEPERFGTWTTEDDFAAWCESFKQECAV